ncbi:MAG: ADP-ribosylation factor-like protein [Candidatus Lokiarchaeota archaeon]
MLHTIFLFKGNSFQNLNHLDIYCYPKEVITIEDKDILKRIISSHLGKGSEMNAQVKSEDPNGENDINHSKKFHGINKPIPQKIDGLNLYTVCIDQNVFVGLNFDEEDNPYDYKEIFQELLSNIINEENEFSFENETEIENLLITLFIDLRRYEDEIVKRFPEIEFYHHTNSFTKVFLFGIDGVGKTSYVRRLKTGKYSDNYYMPTRRFNIEYIKKWDGEIDNISLSVWDMPGQRAFRKKWLIGLQDSNIIIYVIDVANQSRFEEAKKEFWRMINRYELQEVPLLILGNKVDLISKKKSDKTQLNRLKNEICNYFNFSNIKNRNWKFMLTSVKTNYNIAKTIHLISDLIILS